MESSLPSPPSFNIHLLSSSISLGLKRTGKSCRLRWVNYLHPGLKRAKMTPQEERLVLDLHSKWGNRWSRIARKIPGRTDNEIKNYWRTHMRKKAQDQKKKPTPHESSSSSTISSSSSSTAAMETSFYDTGGMDFTLDNNTTNTEIYSMDEIWKDIELSEETCSQPMINNLDFWSMDETESKMLMHNINSSPFYNLTD